MRLACKQCNTILTNDLYPVKDFVKDPLIVNEIPVDGSVIVAARFESSDDYDSNDSNDSNTTYSIKKGTFALLKHANPYMLQFNQYRNSKNNIFVSPEDIIDQAQLSFVDGWGCCGNSYMDFKCPSCSAFLGYQHLDCYDSKHIRFYDKKVTRQYK